MRVEVRAPEACSDERRFFAEVRARTSRVRRASTNEVPLHTLRVQLEAKASVVDGELVIVDSQGSATHRGLSGETCDAVVSGLALVAALALDPRASTAPISVGETGAPGPSVPSGPAPPPEPEPPPPPTEPGRATSPPAEPASPRALPARESASAPPKAPARARSIRFVAGVHAAGVGIAPPGPVVDASAFVDLALRSPAILSPAFRLSVHRTTEATVDIGEGSGSFAWTFGRVEACPLRLGGTRPLGVRPCALFDGGVVDATGRGIAHPQSRLRPWAATGALARLEWSPLRALRLEASLGAVLPLLRESFFFQPSAGIYQPPVVAWTAGLGVGVHFP